MNKHLVFCFSLLFFAASTYAVDFNIGLKGGISISNIHSDYPALTLDYKHRVGPTTNLIGEIIQNDYFCHQIGIGYFQAGGNLDSLPETDELGIITGHGQEVVKLDYLNLSYVAKIKYPFKHVYPFLIIGMQADYMVNSSDIYITSKNVNYTMTDFQYKELRKSNIAPVLGGGFGYSIMKFNLFIEYCLNYPLIPFFKFTNSSNATSKSSFFGHIINLGILYKL
jgi:hypothetical protein